MPGLRLYREFYRVNHNSTGETYSLINPVTIGANVYTSSRSLLESPTVIQESSGRYYVEINNNLYTFNEVYELRWTVAYVSGAPDRNISTFFKYEPTNIIIPLDGFNINQQNEINVEVQNEEIEYIIVNQN